LLKKEEEEYLSRRGVTCNTSWTVKPNLNTQERDEERTCQFIFAASVIPAKSMEEYEQYLINFLQDRVQDYSPTWAVPLEPSLSHPRMGFQ
jgi:hypothetical protein